MARKLSLWVLFYPLLLVCGANRQQTPAPNAAIRRTLYALPEALPSNYAWQIHGHAIERIVWVGYHFNRAGALHAENAQKLAERVHADSKREHYLLIAPSNTRAGMQILSNAESRARSLQSLRQLLENLPAVAGVQFDFEYLPPHLAPAFTAFLDFIRRGLQRTVAVHAAVFAPTGMPAHWSAFHDLPRLAAASDGLTVMLYDLHRQGTGVGCVSGIAWLQANVEILKALPREKVTLGAPLYGYRFRGKHATPISARAFAKMPGRVSNTDGCQRKVTGAAQAYYPSFELYGAYDASVVQYGFAGLAYWRAGLE